MDDTQPPQDPRPFDEGDAFELFGRRTQRGLRWVDFDPSLPQSLDPQRHPSGLLLRVMVLEAGPDGLPSPHEERRLEALEQRLFELLQHHRVEGRLLARATGGGEREWLMVLAREGLADYALRKLARKFPEHDPTPAVVDAAGVLEEDFLPHPVERLGVEVRHRLEAWLAEGVDLSRPALLCVPLEAPDARTHAAVSGAGWARAEDQGLVRRVVPDQGDVAVHLARLAETLELDLSALEDWSLELLED